MSRENDKKKVSRLLTGTVVSNKMNKSVVVSVERRVKHSRYHKFITRSTKIHADDPQNICQIGDRIVIQECRPISKNKRWKLVEIKERVE